MDPHADFRPDPPDNGGVRLVRTTIAYSLLLLGLAASISAVPVAFWMILDRGMQ